MAPPTTTPQQQHAQLPLDVLLRPPRAGEEPFVSMSRFARHSEASAQPVRLEALDVDVSAQAVEDAEGLLRSGDFERVSKPLQWAPDLVGQTLQVTSPPPQLPRLTTASLCAWEQRVIWSVPEDDEAPPLAKPPIPAPAPMPQSVAAPAEGGDIEWEEADAVPKVQTRPAMKAAEHTPWDLAPVVATQATTTTPPRKLTKMLARLARNEALMSDAWLSRVAMDSELMANVWGPVEPHPGDEAFLMDAVQRARKAEAAAPSASAPSLAPPPPPPAESDSAMPPPPPPPPPADDEAAPAPPPPPPQPVAAPPVRKSTNPPGRGPPRKELMARRFQQYGRLLQVMGIYDAERVAVITTPAPKPEDDDAPGWKTHVPPMRHFEPANELEFFTSELRDADPTRTFHRPLTSHRDGVQVKVLTDSKELELARLAVGVRVDGRDVESTSLLRKADLTVREGPVYLFEYAERYPLILNGVGMMSNVLNVYRGPHAPASGLPTTGINVVLAPDEPSPLCVPMRPGHVYRVLQNANVHATLFEQPVAPTDFLLVRGKGQDDQVLLRKITGQFCVGQVEPQAEVFTPSDNHVARTQFTRWIENYMAFHYAGKMLMREDLRIHYTLAERMFSYAPETLVQRSLKMVAEPVPGQLSMTKKYWGPLGAIESPEKELHEFKRDLEDRRRDLLARELRPEEACLWESMQLGLARLKRAGVTHVARTEVPLLLEAFRVIYRLYQLRGRAHQAAKRDKDAALPDEARKRLAAVRYVLRECQLTPWWLSTCYWWLHLHPDRSANPFPSDMVMRVSGLGDASGRGEAVSFLPRYDKEGESGPVDEEDEAFIDPVDGKKKTRARTTMPKPQYERTDADLRLLSMIDLGVILERLGVAKEDIQPVTRWDRTWLIEQVASSPIGPHILNGEIAKYARQASAVGMSSAALGERRKVNTSQAQFTAFKEHVERVYERQAAALSVAGAAAQHAMGAKPNASENVDDDDFIELSGAIQAGLASSGDGASSRSQLEDAEREKRDMEALLRAERERPLRAQQAASSLSSAHEPVPVLKRTIIEVLPNGTERIRVEYHRNAEVIRAWREKDARAPEPAAAAGGGGISSSSAAARPLSQADKARVELKEKQQRELQQKHYAWYQQQVALYGKDFARSYVENDARLPSSMPRRGRSKPAHMLKANSKIMRCTMCLLPGHGQSSPLCPLVSIVPTNAAVKLEGDGTKIKLSRQMLDARPKDDDASPAKRVKGASGAARPAVNRELVARLSQVHQAVMDDAAAKHFMSPVADSAEYRASVHEPMDLTAMWDRINQGAYATPALYIADLQLLVDNSALYAAGQAHTADARVLVELARNALAKSVVASSPATGDEARSKLPGMDALFGRRAAQSDNVVADDDFYGTAAEATSASRLGGDVDVEDEDVMELDAEEDDDDDVVEEGDEEEVVVVVEEGDEEEEVVVVDDGDDAEDLWGDDDDAAAAVEDDARPAAEAEYDDDDDDGGGDGGGGGEP